MKKRKPYKRWGVAKQGLELERWVAAEEKKRQRRLKLLRQCGELSQR